LLELSVLSSQRTAGSRPVARSCFQSFLHSLLKRLPLSPQSQGKKRDLKPSRSLPLAGNNLRQVRNAPFYLEIWAWLIKRNLSPLTSLRLAVSKNRRNMKVKQKLFLSFVKYGSLSL
jgi:hypothetical protein